MGIVGEMVGVALCWCVGGVVGGATGMGTLMIAMPVLTLFLSPTDAVLASCITSFFAAVQLAWVYRKDFCGKDVRDLFLGSLPGSLLGCHILQIASMQALQLMVCAILVCFVLLQLFRDAATFRLPDSTFAGLCGGAACGLVGTSVGMNGAPLGTYVLLKGWPPARARANMVMFSSLSFLVTMGLQGSAGMYDTRLFLLAAAGTAGCWAGQTAGVRLGRHLDMALFRRVVLGFLVLAAVTLFWRAVG